MLPKVFRAPDTPPTGGVEQVYIVASGDEVLLPENFDLSGASFERAGPDLTLTGADGEQIIIADYFMSETPPTLIGTGGVNLSGDEVAGIMEAGADALAPSIVAPIGRVSTLTGDVHVVHADGARETLHAGDPVFGGDTIETGLDSGVGLLLADGTSVSMAAEGRMVLDDVVFDPTTQTGNVAITVEFGVFTIVSVEASIHTPHGTINVQNSQFGLNFSGENGLIVVMMESVGGGTGLLTVTNDAGSMTIDQAYESLKVAASNIVPVLAPIFTHSTLLSTFGVTFAFLPTEVSTANDYGLHAVLAQTHIGSGGLSTFDEAGREDVLVDTAGEEISGFETAAGEQTPPEDVKFGENVEPMEAAEHIAAAAMGEIIITPPSAGEPDFVPEPEPIIETVLTLELAPEPEVEPESALEPAPEPENARTPAKVGSILTAEDRIFSGQLAANNLEGGALFFNLIEGGQASNGVVSIASDGAFTYIPDGDFSGPDQFTYQVSDDAGAAAVAVVSIRVTPVPDVPLLAVAPSVGREDTGIILVIAAAMPAGTNESIASVTISDMPSGASLSAGTDNADGSWTVPPDQLSGLILMPPENFSGGLGLNVTATSTGGGTTAQSLDVTMALTAGQPTLTVTDVVIDSIPGPGEDMNGTKDTGFLMETAGSDALEGGKGDDIIYGDAQAASEEPEPSDPIEAQDVSLDINAALVDVDGSEILSVEISGVPEGASLSLGLPGEDGSWLIAGSNLENMNNLTMALPEGFPDEDFSLNVTATSVELVSGVMSSIDHTVDVNFDTVASGVGDEIFGGQGDDTLDGEQGDDTLSGGVGDNTLEGGQGSDTFVFDAGDGDGDIMDLGAKDELRFDGPEFSAEDIPVTDNADDTTTITFGDDANVSITANDQDINQKDGYTVAQDGAAASVNIADGLKND